MPTLEQNEQNDITYAKQQSGVLNEIFGTRQVNEPSVICPHCNTNQFIHVVKCCSCHRLIELKKYAQISALLFKIYSEACIKSNCSRICCLVKEAQKLLLI
jgi:hypothetical protein